MKVDSIKLYKMPALLKESSIEYYFEIGDKNILVNSFIGKEIEINFSGEIRCVSCDKKIPKSYGQGFCYNCFTESSDNAECIIKPELCQAHLGKGRDPEWEKNHHLKPHTVYLSYTSEIKVGVTRDTQIPTRWIDQGAVLAMPIAEVPYRQLAGRIEVLLKSQYSDKTNWKKMLMNPEELVDLQNELEKIKNTLPVEFHRYLISNHPPLQINYPIQTFPEKIQSLDIKQIPEFKNKLIGIKGQYLIFENGYVFNVRSYSGYVISLQIHNS